MPYFSIVGPIILTPNLSFPGDILYANVSESIIDFDMSSPSPPYSLGHEGAIHLFFASSFFIFTDKSQCSLILSSGYSCQLFGNKLSRRLFICFLNFFSD